MEKTIAANGMKVTFDAFKEGWEELTDEQKAEIFIDWQSENEQEDKWFEFGDEFFNIFFEGNIMEACRAWHFGPQKDWDAEYIRVNTYGNIETAYAWQVAEEADGYLEEIFETPEVWEDVIDVYEDEDED